MAYHGSGSHSPGYDDGVHLQDVPSSQVCVWRGGELVARADLGVFFFFSIARMRMQPADYCPNSRVHSRRPLMTPTRAAFLPSAQLRGTA